MKAISKTIFECGIIPVIKLGDADSAVPLCQALEEGGINVAEITFRTDAAEQAIKNIVTNMKQILVGAGTILNVECVKKAVDAGAKFIISPGFNENVVEYCLKKNIPVFPGVSSPTDIEKGISYGLEILKFFPAEVNGGVRALKAMSAPYNHIKFIPTGGIQQDNLTEYLKLDNVLACGGSWMVHEELLKEKRFEEVTKLSKQAVAKMHNFQFAHMAINTDSQQEAVSLANLFDHAMGTGLRETLVGAFAGSSIEVMNSRDTGEHGHIAFKTTNVARAIAYFEKTGYELDYNTLRGTREQATFIFFKQSFGGFKVHLVQ